MGTASALIFAAWAAGAGVVLIITGRILDRIMDTGFCPFNPLAMLVTYAGMGCGVVAVGAFFVGIFGLAAIIAIIAIIIVIRRNKRKKHMINGS
jgi:hypothetical protein